MTPKANWNRWFTSGSAGTFAIFPNGKNHPPLVFDLEVKENVVLTGPLGVPSVVNGLAWVWAAGSVAPNATTSVIVVVARSTSGPVGSGATRTQMFCLGFR